MQKSTLSNNQQVTLDYIGGLWDGEGHFSICKIQSKKRIFYKAQVAISNTDPLLINLFTDFLKDNNIAFYIRLRAVSSVGKNQYEVSINALDSQRRFLEMVIPCLMGLKKHEASITYKFIMNRINRGIQKNYQRKNDGTFITNGKPPFSDNEVLMYQEYKKLKVPQRLHGMPLPKALKG
jgi:hypothetical protein